MKKQSYIVLTSREFDALIHEHFPERKDFECVPDLEWSNDTDYACENIGIPTTYKPDTDPKLIEKFRQDELDSFDAWLRKEEYSCVGEHQILEALFRKGVLEAGNYLITVSW